MKLGLTGNIATGKSSVFKQLTLHADVIGFDADQVVHDLYKSPDVLSEISQAFGELVLDENGLADRGKLRALFLSDPGCRIVLEGIFHPRVREAYHEVVRAAGATKHVIADIPLLFEKDVSYEFDRVIVVACSKNTQITRLIRRSKLDRSTAQEMINKQVALIDKIGKADYMLWNEGSLHQLQRQTQTLVHHLFNECR